MSAISAKTITREAAELTGPIRTIALATDFSSGAGIAQQWAVELAGQHSARLVIVHAVEPPTPFKKALFEKELAAAATKRLADVQNAVRAAGVRLAAEHGVGAAWKVVIDAAARHDADLIVVGSRGLTLFDRLMIGSTADRIIRAASVPVLTVHPGTSARLPSFRTAVVATDFSESAALATSAAVRLLRCQRGAAIVLLHVCSPPVAYGGPDVPVVMLSDWDQIEQEARRQLETLAAPLHRHGLSVEARVLQGYPVDSILHEAALVKADFIALGTQGRSGLNRLLMGSVAERVVHHAPCPVLTARQPSPDEPVRMSAV
jgi:nucleotide-binding universal stress UspA family protein